MRHIICKQCGKSFQSQRAGRGFCSRQCASRYNYNNRPYIRDNLAKSPRINKYQSNILYIHNTGQFPHSQATGQVDVKFVRSYLKRKYGSRCSICGVQSWNGAEVPLVCDHIDGNHSNYRIKNYRLVCPNCDAQLPTYKSKNKKRGDNTPAIQV